MTALHGSLLLAAFWAAVLGYRGSRPTRFVAALLAGAAASMLLWATMTHQADRFLVPLHPLLAVTSAMGAAGAVHWLRERSGERMVGVDVSGKAGRTRFVPLSVGRTASLMEALPYTGRTHQIRVHAASIGHPVAGDTKYGDKAFNRRMRGYELRRLFLHAAGLRFENPTDAQRLSIEAPLPTELRVPIERLGLEWTE